MFSEKLPRCFRAPQIGWPLCQAMFKTSVALMEWEATCRLFMRLPLGTVERGLLLIIANIGSQLIALFLPNTVVYSHVESRLKIIECMAAKPPESNSLILSYYFHAR